MTRWKTSCLGAIPVLVSCLLQRTLHSNVKNVRHDSKKMAEESRTFELALEGHSLFISGLSEQENCFCYSKIICIYHCDAVVA